MKKPQLVLVPCDVKEAQGCANWDLHNSKSCLIKAEYKILLTEEEFRYEVQMEVVAIMEQKRKDGYHFIKAHKKANRGRKKFSKK